MGRGWRGRSGVAASSIVCASALLLLDCGVFQALYFSGLAWLWPALGLLAVAAVALLWSYRTAPPGTPRWVCPLLKALGFLALAFCLLEPLWTRQRARPGANAFLIVADNSEGLRIKDEGSTRSRGEMLRELLSPKSGNWQGKLEENFDVRRYYFDSRLQNSRDFSELSFDGRSTALGGALRSLRERYHGRPVAGILLLTDGNATDIHGDFDAAGLPPIYPVVIGNQNAVHDIAITQVHTTETDFEDAPVSIQAQVAASGFAGDSVVAQVLDESGHEVATQVTPVRKDNDALAFHFQVRPAKPGLSFYRLVARAQSEAGTKNTQSPTREATLANNSAVISVQRGHGPYRILYVSGRPNWEFKFLNRAVSDDDELQLVALIRVARREPKFNFMGRAGESSNPLFRGFDAQSPEDTERYDQPVLVRLNTKDEFELRGGFPKTEEELFAYHAVIVDDLEAEFFTHDQQALLQKYVSERGGGFLMLGGMETFQDGNYQRTPIGDMLPVYLDRMDESKPPGPLHLDLTREGWLQTWARLRDNEADERTRLKSVAPFQVINKVREAKPGAMVVASVSDQGGKTYPALVVQRFGRGRTAAFTLGDVWHWGLHDADAHKDMDKAWRQLLRWLVHDAPNRVELTATPNTDEANGAVSLEVRARDAKFQPLDNAAVTLQVRTVLGDQAGAGIPTNSISTHPGAELTNSLHLQVEPSAKEPGVYQAAYMPRVTGAYAASVTVTNSEGVEVGHAQAGWSTDLTAEEFRSLVPNVSLLETLAKKTGGEIITTENLASFAAALPHRNAPVMETWTSPAWHTPFVFGFAIVCFAAEWGVRRWKGLP